MSLAKIRKIPAPVPSDVEVDLARLVEVMRQAQAMVEERDELICSLRARGVHGKHIAEVAGLSHQRVSQIFNGTDGHTRSRGGRDGNGTTGDTGDD